MAQKKVGVILSGCGFLDGSEIHEAVLTLLALDRRGAKAVAAAPDVEQMHVVDHLRSQPAAGERRRVLVEAARIVRGDIVPLSKLHVADLDAVVFPGGYGAAKNLSTFAVDGPAMKMNPEIEMLILDTRAAGKPMGFVCIAPMLAAKVLGAEHPRLTIGNDRETAQVLESLGAQHVECPVDGCVVDDRLKIASTPAWMLGPSIAPVEAGIDRMVEAVLRMT